jgi:YD repeat-containing protein
MVWMIMPKPHKSSTKRPSIAFVAALYVGLAGVLTGLLALPGCTGAAVTLPGDRAVTDVTIDYTYDPLNRLTAAEYSDGTFYYYSYDPVGNRLTQDTEFISTAYAYDRANRLTSVDEVPYAWDNNGNLLSDGTNTYAYDSANRLVSVTNATTASSYTYRCNGLSRDQRGIIGCESDRGARP